MGNLSLTNLILIFVLSGLMVWAAGVKTSKATDVLDCRFKIGDALGGLIILGIIGSLPEIAIAYSAAINGHISVIIGNLIGGVAIQTLIIVVFDFAVKGKRPLSYLAGSTALFFETIFAATMILLAVAGTYVSAEHAVFNMNPFSLIILFAWPTGLYFIYKVHKIKRFNRVSSDADPGKLRSDYRESRKCPFYADKSNTHVFFILFLSAIATLIAGVILEESSVAIARNVGIDSGVFAATILALITSLPEISTGLEAIFFGDNHLAISDIWGGNTFMLVPFFAADLILGKPVLSYAGRADRLLAFLGAAMMGVYAISFLIKLRKRYFRLGLDSILQIFLYVSIITIIFYFKLV
jgi:cation:H+ antiporter